MTYSQLRNFSANEYANNNLINEAIKLLCSQKLGWLVSKVDQELHTAADSACQKLTQLAQQGFDLSLNGRILYPHSIIEAQQEYGNLTKGLNITLYTYNNQPYNVTCDGNGGVSLTGLYSTTETTHTEVIDSKAQQLISYNNTNNYASFSTSDYTVHVAQRVYMKYWMYKGCGHGPLQKKPRHHNVESQTVKITIPEGWTFGEIKWGKNKDWYKIDGQTITFLAPEISDSALPSVPIKRL
ncbi:MAG: hypothetical protein EZS28_015162 [Streblomastix strix]|uniref:Uncharacterized protein n=1 Tax=Streblomastix strix TaxID=222440 RepID=A0A5J4W304_9EUKA|nr:MAG: hypothetical protein EZS28_015162 [Streblomastix strix]